MATAAEDRPVQQALPAICRAFNASSCGVPHCKELHICYNKVVRPPCRFGNKCKRPHDLKTVRSIALLATMGWSSDQMDLALRSLQLKYQMEGRGAGEAERPQLPSVCHRYNSGLCSASECNYLHVCFRYVLGDCPRPECPLSHDLTEPYNLGVLGRAGVADTPLSQVLQAAANSARRRPPLPFVCLDHNGRGRGVCPRPHQCPRLHLCRRHAYARCGYQPNCAGCLTPHNVLVLDFFNIDPPAETAEDPNCRKGKDAGATASAQAGSGATGKSKPKEWRKTDVPASARKTPASYDADGGQVAVRGVVPATAKGVGKEKASASDDVRALAEEVATLRQLFHDSLPQRSDDRKNAEEVHKAETQAAELVELYTEQIERLHRQYEEAQSSFQAMALTSSENEAQVAQLRRQMAQLETERRQLAADRSRWQSTTSGLVCSVCLELFVTATTLQCSHTFCKMCIEEVLRVTGACPMCRQPIRTTIRSVVVDEMVENAVQMMSKEEQELRKELIAERQVSI